MSKSYDLTFVGHMCYDEIVPFGGKPIIAPGSAVLCGAMVAARVGKKVAAVVKMAKKDEAILQPMNDAGVDTYLIPSDETTYSRVLHESENVDERKLTLVRSAGLISIEDVPALSSTCVHMAGISDTGIRHDPHEGPEIQGIRAVSRYAEFCPSCNSRHP